MIHKCGNWYKLLPDEDVYILAQVGKREYCLVSLEEGNRLTDPVTLASHAHGITEPDFYSIACGNRYELLVETGAY